MNKYGWIGLQFCRSILVHKLKLFVFLKYNWHLSGVGVAIAGARG